MLARELRDRANIDAESCYAPTDAIETVTTRDDLDCVVSEAAENAVEITNSAGEIISAVVASEGADADSISFDSTVRTQTEGIATAYPDATVGIEGQIPSVDVRGSKLFDTVVRNLITNGIEHNDCSNPRIVVSASQDDDQVTLRVADNGPGVPDAQKRRLFEEGESGASGGSGIGLYLVKALVDRHDGHVEIEDRVRPFDDETNSSGDGPLGSVFTVRLPKAE